MGTENEITQSVMVPAVKIPGSIAEPETFENEAKTLRVNSIKGLERAAEVLKTIAGLKKKVKAAFDENVKKAFDLHRGLTATRKEYLSPLENAENIIKEKMGAYQEAEERKRIEAARKAAEESPEDAPPPRPAPSIEGIAFVESWDFEIVDANLIPREYLAPDKVKIRKVVKALKDTAKIPGLRVFSNRKARTTGR